MKSTLLSLNLFIWLLLGSRTVSAAETLLVLYPDVPAPYAEVFEQIIDGIRQQHPESLVLQKIRESDDQDRLLRNLNAGAPDMVIALGKRGYEISLALPTSLPLVIGALPLSPNGLPGISLLADPGVLFQSLRRLAPSIKRVAVVYTPGNEWLMDLAEQQAEKQGLTLIRAQVADLKEAVSRYESLLPQLDSAEDALWLPLDPVTANEQVILPRLLQYSWDNDLVLFSSKPVHAKRGALFSTFPNHQELGRSLTLMVQGLLHKKADPEVRPLKELKLAVNLRTAAHLGFEYNTQQQKNFSLTFPD